MRGVRCTSAAPKALPRPRAPRARVAAAPQRRQRVRRQLRYRVGVLAAECGARAAAEQRRRRHAARKPSTEPTEPNFRAHPSTPPPRSALALDFSPLRAGQALLAALGPRAAAAPRVWAREQLHAAAAVRAAVHRRDGALLRALLPGERAASARCSCRMRCLLRTRPALLVCSARRVAHGERKSAPSRSRRSLAFHTPPPTPVSLRCALSSWCPSPAYAPSPLAPPRADVRLPGDAPLALLRPRLQRAPGRARLPADHQGAAAGACRPAAARAHPGAPRQVRALCRPRARLRYASRLALSLPFRAEGLAQSANAPHAADS